MGDAPAPSAVPIGAEIVLPEAVAHHALRVVRLAVGDALTLFTGAGGEYAATLIAADRRGGTVRIDAFDPVEREAPLGVTLAQAIAAHDTMDAVIRKAAELGVASIQPLLTARSAPLPEGERGQRRQQHWRQVAIAACEQCGRNRIPVVEPARPLAAYLATWSGGDGEATRGAVLEPTAGNALVTLPAAPKVLLVGPEGGLTTAEIDAACRAGFAAVRLGPRVLRAETAGAAALAAINVCWGDWR